MRSNNFSPNNSRKPAIQDAELEKFPPVDEVLVKALEKRFPDRSADPRDSDRDIWINAGAAIVVRFLREVNESQQEKD